MRQGCRALIIFVVGLVVGLTGAPSAVARDATVSSFDGTPITTAFFPAAGLAPGAKAPTVLIGHGWSMSHGTDPESGSEDLFGSIGIGPLRHAGFNVLVRRLRVTLRKVSGRRVFARRRLGIRTR